MRRAAAGAVALALPLGGAIAADAAGAKTFHVSSAEAKGHGTLQGAVKASNHHRGRDRIVFDGHLPDSIPVSTLTARDPLVIAGPGPTLRSRAADGMGIVETRSRRGEERLTIRRLRLRSVQVRAENNPVTIARSTLEGVDVPMQNPGVDLFKADDSRLIASTISGWHGGIEFFRADRSSVVDSSVHDNGYNGVEFEHSDGTVVRSSVTNNEGGVSVYAGSDVSIADTSIIGNTGYEDGRAGSGVWVDWKAHARIVRSTIAGNENEGGGGVAVEEDSSAEIRNSTISGNTATGPTETTDQAAEGGGILQGRTGSVEIEATTVTGNHAETGGGIFAVNAYGPDRAASVTSSVVAGNSATEDPDCAYAGSAIRSGGGNVFGPDGCGTADPSDVLTADPMLGPLADNGGPTMTHALLDGSPAIGNGKDLGLKTDQRGMPRDADPDSGSFERQ
jgi:hypothetical protein